MSATVRVSGGGGVVHNPERAKAQNCISTFGNLLVVALAVIASVAAAGHLSGVVTGGVMTGMSVVVLVAGSCLLGNKKVDKADRWIGAINGIVGMAGVVLGTLAIAGVVAPTVAGLSVAVPAFGAFTAMGIVAFNKPKPGVLKH